MRFHFLKIIFILILFSIVVISCHKKNRPPYVPYAPSGLSLGVVNIPYDFFTLAIDPDGDSIALRFCWQEGDTSKWSIWLETGEEVTMSHSWTSSDSYEVKVQAKDEKDFVSEWSLPFFVKIVENLPPNTPSIPSGSSIGYVDSLYQFSSSAFDPAMESIAIRFSWGDGDTTDWGDFVPSGMWVITSHSWFASGIYLIKAQAMDVKGLTSGWSLPYSINIRTSLAKRSGRLNHKSTVFDTKNFLIRPFDCALKRP